PPSELVPRSLHDALPIFFCGIAAGAGAEAAEGGFGFAGRRQRLIPRERARTSVSSPSHQASSRSMRSIQNEACTGPLAPASPSFCFSSPDDGRPATPRRAGGGLPFFLARNCSTAARRDALSFRRRWHR